MVSIDLVVQYSEHPFAAAVTDLYGAGAAAAGCGGGGGLSEQHLPLLFHSLYEFLVYQAVCLGLGQQCCGRITLYGCVLKMLWFYTGYSLAVYWIQCSMLF